MKISRETFLRKIRVKLSKKYKCSTLGQINYTFSLPEAREISTLSISFLVSNGDAGLQYIYSLTGEVHAYYYRDKDHNDCTREEWIKLMQKYILEREMRKLIENN